MSFFLLHDNGNALLATDRPLLKARDRMRTEQAIDLLDRAREWERGQAARTAAALSEARARGLREGRQRGLADFTAAIGELARQAEEHRAREEREIAALALSALRRMIDDIGPATMMAGLAKRAVAAVLDRGETQIYAAPALCDRIAETLSADEATSHISVMPDPDLAEHQCRITAGDTRIVADLPLQLAAIEDRWSVPHGD